MLPWKLIMPASAGHCQRRRPSSRKPQETGAQGEATSLPAPQEFSVPDSAHAERQERLIREWFERQLITPRGQRNRVLLEPERSGGLA